MKIMETATFRFHFKDINSKEDSYRKLQQFLAENDWLDEKGNKKIPLDDYHTEKDGSCEITLAEEKRSEEFIDLIEELFESLIEVENVKWITTYYNDNTFNLVHKHAGKYLNNQTVDLSEMNYGDEICIFLRKK